MSTEIIWATVPNINDTRLLAQHAYIEKTFKTPYTGEPYSGNISLCGKSSVAEDYDTCIPANQIEKEELNESRCCKICLKISKKK